MAYTGVGPYYPSAAAGVGAGNRDMRQSVATGDAQAVVTASGTSTWYLFSPNGGTLSTPTGGTGSTPNAAQNKGWNIATANMDDTLARYVVSGTFTVSVETNIALTPLNPVSIVVALYRRQTSNGALTFIGITNVATRTSSSGSVITTLTGTIHDDAGLAAPHVIFTTGRTLHMEIWVKCQDQIAGTTHLNVSLTQGTNTSLTLPGSGLRYIASWFLAAGITPSGAVVNTPTKLVSGSMTLSGAVLRQASKILTGTMTLAGVNVSQATHRLDGTIAPAGTVSKLASRLLSGGITPASAPISRTAKPNYLSGAMAMSGQVQSLPAEHLSGSLPSAGAVNFTPAVHMSGAVSAAGQLSRTPKKWLAGAITLAGTLRSTPTKLISGAISSAGALAYRVTRTLTGSVTSAGSLSFTPSKLLGSAITSSGVVKTTIRKSFSGTVTSAGSMRFTASRLLAGVIAPAGEVTRALAKAVTGAITMSGQIAKQPIKNLRGRLYGPTGDGTATGGAIRRIFWSSDE